MELIATTAQIAIADVRERPRLGSLLGAAVPSNWPPALLEDHLEQFAEALTNGGVAAVGWQGWYLVRREPAVERTLIGSAGLHMPGANGDCIIGYSLLPEFWRSGYASEAVAALLTWAAADARVKRFVAFTYPHLVASVRVLEKNGFLYVGAGEEPGTIRFERPVSTGL